MAALQKESSSALTQSLRLSRENQVLVAEKDNVARRVMSFGANWNIAYHWRLVEEGKTLSAPCTDAHSVELVRCVRSIVSNEGFTLRISL
ncbi:unnamed protein product [Microthlaspi erraticum]|uniref:Uncharacterized protein n=1 Tax=Microthlaspi erraticum TaxID=1685480 RepID=A0A6D2JMD6_9BRAS|nr:unnamed protein product [Microthlaspi erraticum]